MNLSQLTSIIHRPSLEMIYWRRYRRCVCVFSHESLVNLLSMGDLITKTFIYIYTHTHTQIYELQGGYRWDNSPRKGIYLCAEITKVTWMFRYIFFPFFPPPFHLTDF